MSAILDLSFNSPYNDRNQKLSFLIDISLIGMTPGDIMGLMLVLNDEDMSPDAVNNIRYYNIDFSTIVFTNGYGQVSFLVPSDLDFIRNGDEYTARAMIEHNNGTLFKSNTVLDIVPFTIPDRPAFSRVDPTDLIPRPIDASLVDAGFDLKLLGIEDESYWNGGSPLLNVKWIWSKVTGAGTGMIEFKTITYDPNSNLYRIDVSDSMFSDGILDLSDNYEVSVVVRNLAGESVVSQGLVLNALNIPDRPLGLMASVDPLLSTPTSSVITPIFHYPFDYANSDYKALTYRVFWDLSADLLGVNSSYVDFDGSLNVFDYSSPSYIFVNLALDTPTVANKTVYLKVQARNINGGSALSNMACIAPYSPSAAPTNIRVKLGPLDVDENTSTTVADAATDGSRSAIVYFTAPSPLVLGSTASFVRYEVIDNSDNVLGFNDNENDNFVALSELSNFTPYNIKVRVQTSYQFVTYNGVSSAQYNMTPFTFPLNVDISYAIEGDKQVEVGWTASDSHSGFPVYYRIRSKLTSATDFTFTAELSDLSFNFTDLLNSNEYIFEITPFYIVDQQYYTVGGIWSNDGTLKYYGNPTTVTKIPIKEPSLGSINLVANLGPMKSDFSAANYASEIQNNYDGNNKVVLSWVPPLQTDLSLSSYVSFVNYEIADSNDNIKRTITDRTQTIAILDSNDGVTNYVIGRYKIRATVTNGNVQRTSSWSALTANAAPFIYPIDVTINSAVEDDAAVAIEWSASDSHSGFPVHYRIGYKLSSASDFTYENVDDISHNFTGLTNSFSHDFEITPYYLVNGNAYYGNSATVSKTPFAPPSLGEIDFVAHYGPMKLDLSAASYAEDASYSGDNMVVLTWNTPSDADLGLSIDVSFVNYEIADSSGTILATITDRNVDLYVLTSQVSNGTAKQYKIRANVSNGNIALTSQYSDLTESIAPFTFPAAPTGLNANGANNYIGIFWNNAGLQYSYAPKYRVEGDGNPAVDLDGVYVQRVYTVYGRHSGNAYTFIEAPTTVIGTTTRYYSSPVSWTSVSFKRCDTVSNFKVLAGPLASLTVAASTSSDVVSGYDGSNSVVITWDQPTDAELGLGSGDGIAFLKYVLAKPNGSTLDITNRATVQYVATAADGVADGVSKSYYIQVITYVSGLPIGTQPINATGSSPAIVSNTSFTFPPALTGLGIVSDDTIANVSWNTFSHPIAGINKKFLVEWKLSSAASWDNSENVVNLTSYQITGLTNNETYDVRVTPYISVTQYNDLGSNDYYGDAQTDVAYPIGTPLAITNFNVLTGPLDASLNPTPFVSGVSIAGIVHPLEGITGSNMVNFVWKNPSDISSWGNGSSVEFVRFEVEIENNSGATDVCENFLTRNSGAGADEVVAKYTRRISPNNINNHVNTGFNIVNGISRKYRVRVVTKNTDATPVFKYSDWSNQITANPFQRPSDISGNLLVTTSQNEAIALRWVDIGTQSGYTNTKYAIFVDGELDQTTAIDASNAVIGGLTNGTRYDGEINTVITATWDNANGETADYYSNGILFSAVPTTVPLPPKIVTESKAELDRNITFTLDVCGNTEYPFWTLNNYTVYIWEIEPSRNFMFTVPANTTFYDVSNAIGRSLTNGVRYQITIFGNYTFNDGTSAPFDMTTNSTEFTLNPYGKPIFDTSATIVGFNSCDVQIHVDPNGRALENVWLVGIPESLDTTIDNDWNFVYSSELDNSVVLPTALYGPQIIQLNNPFNSTQTSTYLRICYMFASNLRGTSGYEEVGDNAFALP